ncbi:MAG: signal peptidase II [Elusimicrobiaceae bacterium]|nr:signal peptidase II [Elusimicrobiaceae bacterium]
MPNWSRMSAWIRAYRGMLIVAALLLLVDRATKVWALTSLVDRPIVVGKYLWLNYVENTGMAFGLFQNGNAVLEIVMLLVIGYIIYSWREIAQYGKWAQWGAVLILSGALGNLYDRITLGFVVDFIDFRIWPVFNAADSFITVGALLLAISLLKYTHSSQEKI